MSAATKRERDPVAEAAARALEDAGGDVQDAVARMETAVRHSDSLRDALTEPLIHGACADAVRAQVRSSRRQVWAKAAPATLTPEAKAKDRERVVQLSRGTLMAFPLPGGLRLAEARAADVSRAADFYDRQAGDMAHKARWLRLIGQHLTGRKTVGKALNEDRLRELQAEAQADAE